MHSGFILSALLSGIALSGTASAMEVHRVAVGKDGLTFTPNSTTAALGDVVEFVFYPKNHSVVQSTFANPCESQTGFFSGFMPVSSGSANMTFRIAVNDTKPIWFYCSQAAAGGHCAHGMVGCVNCPTSNNTLDKYAQAAMKTTNTSVMQPAIIQGGVFAQNQDVNSTSTNSSATGSASSTSSASASASATNGTHVGAATTVSASRWLSLSVAGALGGLAFFVL